MPRSKLTETCQGKVLDTINDDREIKLFRGKNGSHRCVDVIKEGKKQYDRKYTFHPDNPKNDTLIPYNTKRRR